MKKWKFTMLVLTVASLFAILRWSPLSVYFEKEAILGFMKYLDTVWWGPVVFITVYSLACVVAFPGSILTLSGGAVFGTFWGTAYNLAGANLGASLAFGMARFLGRDFVKSFLKQGKLKDLDEKAAENGFQTILILRLIPIVPFNALNFGSGFSKIHYRDYLLGSLIGMLPGTFIYTYFADSLLSGVSGVSRQAYMHLAIAGIFLIILSFTPKIYRKMKQRKPQ